MPRETRTTVIDVYPPTTKPSWVEVGVTCTVVGEGSDRIFRIVEIDDDGCRAAVEPVRSPDFAWWESYTKLQEIPQATTATITIQLTEEDAATLWNAICVADKYARGKAAKEQAAAGVRVALRLGLPYEPE